MEIREKLVAHLKKTANAQMYELLGADPARANRYTLALDDLYINYSRHRITDETLDLLYELAQDSGLAESIDALFTGKPVNLTENRPALHTALRVPGDNGIKINGVNISGQIQEELSHMESFVTRLHKGEIRGYTGKPVNTLVNIGIGGSHAGPRFVYDALKKYRINDLKIYFVSNIDYREIDDVLQKSDPETTLFIISSKSFTTAETLTNAQTAKRWLNNHGCNNADLHFIAVTSAIKAAEDFGIAKENIFRIWDWVGGRYSVWSATGLPVAAGIGMENYRSFLAGAHIMDEHFRTCTFEKNIPVLLGLLDTWYINFFNTKCLAIIPYDQSLKFLLEYLSQLIMESNGKSLNHSNEPVTYTTSPVIWGGIGTNAQHTFMQLLHQGTHLIPVDFLIDMDPGEEETHHNLLLANCLAQGEALMNGNLDKSADQKPYNKVNGNNPSTTIAYHKLTPQMLGMLLAMYEHRTFVQAVIWDINPFDQWGVELGKKISGNIKTSLENNSSDKALDATTTELLNHYYQSRNKK